MGRGVSAHSRALIDASLGMLEAIQPASVRAVCYQLFVARRIPNMGKNATATVSRLLVRAREEGTIPWEWIVDDAREARRVATWSGTREIMTAMLDSFRLDYWKDQPNRVHLICEKATVASTLRPVLDAYAVPVSFMKGFASATAVNDLARMIIASPKPIFLLYAGDHDPSGRYMSDIDLPQRLGRYGAPAGSYRMYRIAVTSEQAHRHELPSFPVADKHSDARFDWFLKRHGHLCWELDALNPNELRDLVRVYVEALLDRDAWEHAKRAEDSQRHCLELFCAAYPGA